MEEEEENPTIVSLFPIALKELACLEQKSSLISRVLQCIEFDIAQDNKCYFDFELPFIASYLHQLYIVPSSMVRTSVLHICFQLDLLADKSTNLCELYHFDYLIAVSLEQKTTGPSSKSDEEKQACFEYIILLLKAGKNLTLSIIRALISCYYSQQKQYKSLILSLLCEYTILTNKRSKLYKKQFKNIDNDNNNNDNNIGNDSINNEKNINLNENNIKDNNNSGDNNNDDNDEEYDEKEVNDNLIIYENVFEIGIILIESLLENGQQNILDLIVCGFENRFPIISNRLLMIQLLSPLSQFEETLGSCDKTCSAISNILRTWPGFFVFGIEMGVIKSLVSCVSHKTRPIIQIFKNLLVFCDRPNIISNSYFGFLIKILIDFNFLSTLNELTNGSVVAASFYNSLLPFVTQYVKHKLPKPGSNIVISKVQCDSNDIFSKMCDVPTMAEIISYQLPLDINSYDWNIIQMKLAVFLPVNENDARNLYKNFYNNLIEYFSGPFLHTPKPPKGIVSDCLIGMVDFLMESNWGISLISSSEIFKSAFQFAIHSLYQNAVVDPKSSIWAFFKSISHLMSTQNGVSLLTKFGLLDNLRRLGDLCGNLAVVEQILSIIRFDPDGGWAIPVFGQFLNSQNPKISSLAIKELRRKVRKTSVFSTERLFSMLLIPHIKVVFSQKAYGQLFEPLGLLMELAFSDRACFKTVGSDAKMHEALSTCDHFIYSYILSDPDSYSHANLQKEVDWWMEKGNLEYVTVFDKAIEYTFTHNEDILIQYPAIIQQKGFAQIPPHLFSQMSQNKLGLELLSSQIPNLILDLKNTQTSKNRQRAAFFALAHFASNPSAMPIIAEKKIAEIMIETALLSDSYVLKGTLINCLSLFVMTDSFAKILQEKGFELFTFGSQKVIVPSNISLFQRTQTNNSSNNNSNNRSNSNSISSELCYKIDIPVADPSFPKEYNKAFGELLNPITEKDAKGLLFTAYREKTNELATTCAAVYSHQLLSCFNFSADSRTFIFSLFKQTPLMEAAASTRCDPETVALSRAKIFQLSKLPSSSTANGNGLMMTSFSRIETPLFNSAGDLIRQPICKVVPEVYLREKAFLEATGMDKKSFYNLDEEKQTEIRSKLLVQ